MRGLTVAGTEGIKSQQARTSSRGLVPENETRVRAGLPLGPLSHNDNYAVCVCIIICGVDWHISKYEKGHMFSFMVIIDDKFEVDLASNYLNNWISLNFTQWQLIISVWRHHHFWPSHLLIGRIESTLSQYRGYNRARNITRGGRNVMSIDIFTSPLKLYHIN